MEMMSSMPAKTRSISSCSSDEIWFRGSKKLCKGNKQKHDINFPVLWRGGREEDQARWCSYIHDEVQVLDVLLFGVNQLKNQLLALEFIFREDLQHILRSGVTPQSRELERREHTKRGS